MQKHKVLWENEQTGSQVLQFTVVSQILGQARYPMDTKRPLTVFLPGACARDQKLRLPVLYVLAPWTNAGRAQFEWRPFRESLPERLDRLIESQKIPPCLVVAPDLYTSFGGSQFIDSDFLGHHASHIVKEVVPFVEKTLPALTGAKHRGVMGRSSGGFGALRLAMDFPGEFNAVASHSGDLGFEWVYRRELIGLAQGLQRYQGNVSQFLQYCWQSLKLSGHETHLLMLLGMGASYSPALTSPDGFELPIDCQTGALRPEVWKLWDAHDPVQRIEQKHQELGLRQLGCLYLDCGFKDQYYLHFGARQFSQRLKNKGISHTYEEFDDNHSGTEYRFDRSLPLMLGPLS